jgi:hypothetical protein
MKLSPAPQSYSENTVDRPFATRRELMAAATALLASAAAGSPAQAGVGAEGYFIVFEQGPGPPNDRLDRVFFIPSAWLELFEVTDVYKARYPSNWKNALTKIRGPGTPGKKQKFHALYADTTESNVFAPFPGLAVVPPVPPAATQTYLAAMLSPLP